MPAKKPAKLLPTGSISVPRPSSRGHGFGPFGELTRRPIADPLGIPHRVDEMIRVIFTQQLRKSGFAGAAKAHEEDSDVAQWLRWVAITITIPQPDSWKALRDDEWRRRCDAIASKIDRCERAVQLQSL
jgi:hypothetical protein